MCDCCGLAYRSGFSWSHLLCHGPSSAHQSAYEQPGCDNTYTSYRDPHNPKRDRDIRVAGQVGDKPGEVILTGSFNGKDQRDIVERGAQDQENSRS